MKDKDGKVTNYVVPTLEEALLTAKEKSWLIWTKHMTFLTMYMLYWKNRNQIKYHEGGQL